MCRSLEINQIIIIYVIKLNNQRGSNRLNFCSIHSIIFLFVYFFFIIEKKNLRKQKLFLPKFYSYLITEIFLNELAIIDEINNSVLKGKKQSLFLRKHFKQEA
jgi:hypothetical protein